MSDSPESVVREFLAAWADAKPDELAKQLAISHPIKIEVITLVANGATVMVERRGGWTMGGKPISTTVMAAFEIDANGQINRWRESYDMKSITGQIETAGYKVT